jgi:hypothetical protein
LLRISSRFARPAAVVVVLLAGTILIPALCPAQQQTPPAQTPPPTGQQPTGPGQETKQPEGTPKSKDDSTIPTSKDVEKLKERIAKSGLQYSTVEVIVETTIIAYGGRVALKASRSAIQESGSIRLATEQGDATGDFTLRAMRKDKSWEDLLRTDLELNPPDSALKAGAPSKIKYTLAFNGASVWAAQNDQYITPSPESEAAFRSQLCHDYTTLLRYKEDGSKIELIGPETVVGIDTQVIDLTTPGGEKTRFWISAKTYRILHLEYELTLPDKSTRKIRVSYYYSPFRVVQNTLVPTRRVMEQGGKFVQEIDLNSFSYAAKLDTQIFQHLQS